MSGSGGIVYSGAPGASGGAPYGNRYGDPFTLTAGSAIPPGVYFVTSTWTINKDGTSVGPFQPGLCISDGFCTVATAGTAIPLGAKDEPPIWPWPLPWPLSIAA